MGSKKVFDIPGIIIAIVTFALSFYFLFDFTDMLFNCIVASLLAAGMIWGTYITIRMCILSTRRDE